MSARSSRLVAVLVAVVAAVLLAACQPAPPPAPVPRPPSPSKPAPKPTTTTTTAPKPTTTTTAPAPTTTTTTPPPAGSGLPDATGFVSVRDHGARGDGTADDTAAVQAAFAAAAATGTGVVVPAGTYRLTATIAVPAAVEDVVLASGAVLRQHADASIFQKVGSVGTRQYAVGGATRGTSAITVDATTGLDVGDWILIGSDDFSDLSKQFRHGFLRQVRSISGTTVGLDRPLHRTLATNARGWEVALAPPLRLHGGVLEHANPLAVFQPTVHLELVRSPQVTGTEIRQCGASAIKVMHVLGGTLDAYTHHCVDDEGGARFGSGRHYGYGVEAGGTTRDLVVRGRATRVRHAFTTNGAYGPRSDKRILLIGEPEDVVVSMDVWETTSSGLDTHEVGWNITFRDCSVRDAGTYKRQGSTNGKEGGFGIFIRARHTVVERCTVTRAAEDGIVVAAPSSGLTAWAPADGPKVRDTEVLDTEGKRGVHLKQPATLERFTVDGHHLVGVHLDATAAGSALRTGTIDLGGYAGGIGVLNAGYAEVSGIGFVGVAAPIR